MASAYSFRPRAWAVLAAAAACAAGIALGNWQAGRAEEKTALAAARKQAMQAPPVELGPHLVAADAVAGRRVAAEGRFVARHTIFLDNKLRRGEPGYEVLTPLALNGVHVLVNRGWVAAGRRREVLPAVATPEGIVQVEGLALERLPRALPAGESRGPVRQNLELEAVAKETGLRLQPFVIEQYSPAADGLVRDWPRPDAGAEKHAAYALQWYSLAGLAVALLVASSLRRVPQG